MFTWRRKHIDTKKAENVTIYNQPTQGNENEETTDLIRSVTLSSARLWEEVLDRITRIEQNQEELANAISRLQRELPVGNTKSELAEFSDSFVNHGVSEIGSVVSPMQPTSILEMPPPPLGFSEAPSQGPPVLSNVDLDSKLDNLSLPQVSPIDNLLASEFGLHEPASGISDPLASLFGTTGAPPPPPPPPPPPGFGDSSFGTASAPPPPPPPPPGFSPEDFAGENAIGATPTTGSGDVESRPEAPPGVLPPIPAPPEPAITPDFFARATRSKK